MMLMKLLLKPSLLVLLLSFGPLAACGPDHRTEDFCNMLCACDSNSDEEQAQCAAGCSGAVDASEESQGFSPISDECYACVTNTSCQVIETSCASACADLADAFNGQTPDPEPDPGESN